MCGLDNEFHGGLSLDIYTIRKIVPKGIYTPFNHNTHKSRNKVGASKTYDITGQKNSKNTL